MKEPKAEFEGSQKELKGNITWCEKGPQGPQENAKKSCAHVLGVGGCLCVYVCVQETDDDQELRRQRINRHERARK